MVQMRFLLFISGVYLLLLSTEGRPEDLEKRSLTSRQGHRPRRVYYALRRRKGPSPDTPKSPLELGLGQVGSQVADSQWSPVQVQSQTTRRKFAPVRVEDVDLTYPSFGQTPINVPGGIRTPLRSNIPLPHNPFMSSHQSHIDPEEPLFDHFWGDARHSNSRSDSLSSHYTKIASGKAIKDPYSYSSSKAGAEFASILSKLERIEEMKEAFPPRGSNTPYGERTVLLVKFPGLPERRRPLPSQSSNDFNLGAFGRQLFRLGGVKPITLPQNDDLWSASSSKRMKDPDYGVLISQNYILQPDFSINSAYSDVTNALSEDDDLVAELAKALAERNRIMNSQAVKDQKPASEMQPPFVLIHLETFTKKRNKTTNFGFDEDIETSFANGTIIYPTLNDPSVLASTKFFFENGKDIEAIFDAPLETWGRARNPVVPLGLVDIMGYLRLMHGVHQEVHNGGRVKVKDLREMSYKVERAPLSSSRNMTEGEVSLTEARYKDNWLHTSTIGVRTLSDYPPPPIKLPLPYPT